MMLKDISEMFADDLRDPAYAAGYLNIALEDNGIEGFLHALQKVTRTHGVREIAFSSDMPRESLYRALSDKGNPSVKTLGRVLASLGLQLAVSSSTQASCIVDKHQAEDEVKAEPQAPESVSNLEADVSAVYSFVQEEFAAMREQARAEQEESRQATLQLQQESRLMLAQIQHLTDALAKQANLTSDHNVQPSRAARSSQSIFSFPTRAGKQSQTHAEPSREITLKLVEIAA